MAKIQISVLILAQLMMSSGHLSYSISDVGCGSTKKCLYMPDNCKPFENCEYFTSFATNREKNTIVFEILAKSRLTADQYVAIGFSDDQKMGQDSVTYCMHVENGETRIGLAHNPSGYERAAPIRDPKDEKIKQQVQLLSSGLVEGNLWCTFVQNVQPTFLGPEVRNLNSKNYILLATGSANSKENFLGIHGTKRTNINLFPYISGSKVNVWDQENFTNMAASASSCVSETTYSALYRTHGILMIFGWWVFIAIGILWARYFRTLVTNKKIFGSPYWFFFHRFLNVVGVILVASAFICIFVAACGIWSNDDHAYNHSVLGMTASVCAFVQPLLSLVRCSPDHSSRFIFNWVHRIIGVCGFGCACACIWCATIFEKTGLHLNDGNGYAPRGMIIFYYVSVVAVVLLLEIGVTLADRCKARQDSVGVATTASNQVKIEPLRDQSFRSSAVWNFVRLSLLGVFALIAIAVAITIACFIGLY